MVGTNSQIGGTNWYKLWYKLVQIMVQLLEQKKLRKEFAVIRGAGETFSWHPQRKIDFSGGKWSVQIPKLVVQIGTNYGTIIGTEKK